MVLDLLTRETTNPTTSRQRMRNAGLDPAAAYCIVAAQPSDELPRGQRNRIAARLPPGSIVLPDGSRLVGVVPTENPEAARQYWNAHIGGTATAGIAGPTASPADLHRCYREAINTMHALLTLGRTGTIATAEELGIYRTAHTRRPPRTTNTIRPNPRGSHRRTRAPQRTDAGHTQGISRPWMSGSAHRANTRHPRQHPVPTDRGVRPPARPRLARTAPIPGPPCSAANLPGSRLRARRIAVRFRVVLGLCYDGGRHRLLITACPIPGRELRTPGWPHRSEPRHTDPGHLVVDRLHATAHQVRLMPEPSAPSIFQELLPPLPVWVRASPPLQAVEVSPVLPHADVGRKQATRRDPREAEGRRAVASTSVESAARGRTTSASHGDVGPSFRDTRRPSRGTRSDQPSADQRTS